MNRWKITTLFFLLCTILLLFTPLSFAADNNTVKDPFIGFNKVMLDFNERIDITILKPIATLYNKIIPKPLNQGINNFFNNIHNLPNIVNDLLQLHFTQAANDSWRLLINTTLGIGGLFDVAERINLPLYTNDFGLTLARWGYTDSTYIVWPFWGTSTIRDGIGGVVDYFLFSIYPHVNPASVRYELYGLGVVDRRAQLLQLQPMLDEAILDQYIFMRHVYMQGRASQIENNVQLGYDARSAVPVEPYAISAEIGEEEAAIAKG
ncbi:MAG TPA: VacJ family lipoprotein [Gammaproteobacteria bacterium]|nr:VacJ family lipoprotein [Gammaproteobacteria bacterium]